MKILLVEDDESISTFIKKGLAENGHIVDVFVDGSKGLEAAYLEEHDLIILDRMLPNMDGIFIVQQLRKDKIMTPVLFLSALSLLSFLAFLSNLLLFLDSFLANSIPPYSSSFFTSDDPIYIAPAPEAIAIINNVSSSSGTSSITGTVSICGLTTTAPCLVVIFPFS